LSCEYFATREDAEKHHDYMLKDCFSDFTASNKELHKDKFYSKNVSKLESNLFMKRYQRRKRSLWRGYLKIKLFK